MHLMRLPIQKAAYVADKNRLKYDYDPIFVLILSAELNQICYLQSWILAR